MNPESKSGKPQQIGEGDYSRLLQLLSGGSPKLTVNRHRWLHAGFRHLGRLDTVWVLEGLLATAIQLDGRT